MERIELIPLAHLRESPFNPRKTYPEADLAALAESIASQGVLQPIVVRPLPEAQTDIEHTHELVFGHRRFRAAQLAELEEIPCIVRDLSDRDAAIAQTHENAKRADVTAFEEADSFAHLMQHHGLSADQVAAAVGKSRSYVYGRLKLHNAAPVVRQAFAEQGLSAEIALELARIPNAKLQGEALKRCKGYSGDWLSTREAKNALKYQYVFDLTKAPFGLGDATLDPSAGACHSCPKASFNDPDLASEPGHFCMEEACYQGKEAKQRERYLDEMAAAGHTVLEGEEAKAFMPTQWQTPKGFMRASECRIWRMERGEHLRVTFEQMLDRAKAAGIKPPMRTLVVLDTDKEPIELLHNADAQAFQKALHLVGDDEESDDDDAPARDPLAGWSPVARAMHDPGIQRQVRTAAIQQLRSRRRTTDDLRLMLHYALDMDAGDFGLVGEVLGLHEQCFQARALHEEQPDGESFDEDAWYRHWVHSAGPDDLACVAVGLALDGQLQHDPWDHNPLHFERAAQLALDYGVDVLAFAQPAPTPSPAARAPEEGAADAPAAPALNFVATTGHVDAVPNSGDRRFFPVEIAPKGPAKKTKGQKVDAGGAAAVERAEAAA